METCVQQKLRLGSKNKTKFVFNKSEAARAKIFGSVVLSICVFFGKNISEH